VAANPNFIPVHFYLAKYYLQTGQHDLWLKESAEDDRLAGARDRAQFLQQSYAQGGFTEVMEGMAKPSRTVSVANGKRFRLDSCGSAEANAVLGRSGLALSALEDCYRWSEPDLLYLKVDPVWTSLRSEPRFQDLLGRLHLQ
jgi:hypothetical protein